MKPVFFSLILLFNSLVFASDWQVQTGLIGQAGNNTWNDDTKLMVLPNLNISWRERVSLSLESGLAVHAGSEDSGQLTASLYLDTGREAKELTKPWRDLGDIKPAATVNLSGSYWVLPILQLGGGVTHIVDYDGSAKGQTANLSLTTGLPLTEQLIVFTQGSAQLASQDYLQSYYGISKEQASKHGQTAFEPEAGIYQYDHMLGVVYEPGNQWSAMLGMQNNWLVGDASKSELVERKHTLSGLGMVTYAF